MKRKQFFLPIFNILYDKQTQHIVYIKFMQGKKNNMVD
jgi:hypothetical protein